MDVILREATLHIPTYKILAPSVNPALFGKHFHPFPYAMQNHLDETLAPTPWRAVELENEYLKLVVLPDMGGHVAELYDKVAGRSVFTPIHEIKPRMIAHRGAWAAGGLEFNFPISHSPTTMDSVNTTTRRYPDGSASVIFGAIERLSFMNWKVELRLYPGRAYMEQSVELMNPTDNFHRFYMWSNAAVPYVRGMRMAYPFDWRTSMYRSYEKWPMDGATDSSDPAKVMESYETFGKLMVRDHFGVHYPEWDFGVAHSASRKRVKGAKFFHWGNSELAAAWNRALLPGDEQYIEIQSGPFESQAVYRHLAPGARIGWKEYWYGVRGVGQFCGASPDAALAVERFRGGAVVRLSANARFDGAVVRLTHGSTVEERAVSLSPESPEALEFTGVGAEEKLCVDVLCSGELALSFGHGAGPMPEQPDTDLYEDARTLHPVGEYGERPLARGMQHEQWSRLAEAAEAYEEALCSSPECTTALTRLGRIRLTQRKSAEAIDCFERALRYDNRCGAARFGLAAARNMAGDVETARRLYYDILSTDPLFEASILEAAALNVRLGDPFDNAALLEGMESPRALFLSQVSRRLIGLAPLPFGEPGAYAELLLAERFRSTRDSSALLALTGGREDQLVAVALAYAAMGLSSDGLSVLSLVSGPGMKTALALAACGVVPVEEALTHSLDAVFVNEPILLDLLERSSDATGRAAWLLGCFQYSVGLMDEALASWLDAYGKGLRHTALLFSLGQAYALCGESCVALEYLREDAALHGSSNAESLALLCRVLQSQGDIAERLALLPLLQKADNRPMVLHEITEALRDSGRFEEAMELMQTARFQNWEGGETAGLLWSGVVGNLALKLAREGRVPEARAMASRMFVYPEGLFFGRSPNRSQAEHYLALGRVYRLTGDFDKAAEAFKAGALEGGVPVISANADAMKWVRMCQDELNRV